MILRFTKMHGLGNDFVVIDLVTQRARLTEEQIRFLSDRHLGIGCDQLLLVEPPRTPEADFLYRIFNADGREVEQCGNGARCFARFVHENRLTAKNRILAETAGGLIELNLNNNATVTVNMGPPVFRPENIPFQAEQEASTYMLAINDTQYEISAVSMGNPHAVLLVENTDSAPVKKIGSKIECHARFPNKVNVGFMQIVDRKHIRLRVYERGVGETRACGTGACAAVVSGIERGLLDKAVRVDLPGGSLQIEWQGRNKPVLMTGEATSVFRGQVRL
ncbi:MAG: diaminopimelate epimerase [Pseudomonadales bacterium]|nr:diaminopimelate epimerase [Pseudomonadales bacterium]